MKRIVATALTGPALLLVLASQARAADQVHRTGTGEVLALGTITEVTRDGVVVRETTGRTLEIPANEVGHIEWNVEPPGMGVIRSAERNGDLDGALRGIGQALQALSSLSNATPHVAADLEYARARITARLALADPNRIDEAISLLEAFRDDNPDSYHYYPLHEWLAQLYIAHGDEAAALQALQTLGGAPFRDFAMRAGILEGRLRMDQDQLDQALALFDRVLEQPAETPEELARQREALLAKSTILTRQQNFAEAEALLEQLIAQADPEDAPLQAEAHNNLADCLRQQGRTMDALLNYLYVHLLYPSVPDQHARALYHLSRVWSELGNAVRADEAAGLLQQQYPDSQWAAALAGGTS